MRLHLTDPQWRYGGYTRGSLAGDILLGQYSYADASAVMMPRMVLARDLWAEKALENGWITGEQESDYATRLQTLLSRFVTDMESPYEAIYDAVCALRREAFGPDALDRIFLETARKESCCRLPMDIDQEETGRTLLRQSRYALFLLDDAALAPWMRRDMAFAADSGAAVRVLYGGEGTSFAGREVLKALLGSPPDVEMGPNGLGDCEGDEGLAAAVERGEACLFWYGDRGLSSCRCLRLPAMVKCVPRSLLSRALTGQFTETGRCAVYVPPSFDILPFVPLVRPTAASFRHFAWLYAVHGGDIYSMTVQDLYRRFPETFFSLYEEKLPGMPPGMKWRGDMPQTEDWYADFCRAREAAVGAFLDGVSGVRRVNGWFALDTLEKQPVPWSARGEAKGILVHGLVIDRIDDAGVILAEGTPVSPRALLYSEMEPPALQVFTNYLFFMTSRLIALYNRLREDRPREQLRCAGGHMDYLLRVQDGKRLETFPLYQKGCMGMTEDGQFVFFHFRLRGGQCAVNGHAARWTETDVDPAEPGDAAVYTPYLSCPDSGASRYEYLKAVGQGRVNFVIHQNELVCVREGDVLLPCVGVVLSLSKETGRAFAEACGLYPAEDGYFAWREKPRLEIRLDGPEGIPPSVWKKMKWAYGGGLTLATEGQCVFRRDGDAAQALALEGWASPLSSQTQESDIAALVRHPRTAIGQTRDGKLFMLVFSGRSPVTAGADYIEMCEIAKKLVPDLKEMINVDGGASSVLGLGVGRRFIEYSRPSSSFDSLHGMVRPVNSLFRAVIR